MSKDIEDIFSDKMEAEITEEIKKKRNRLNLKLIIISVISTIVIIVTGIFGLNYASEKYINDSYRKDYEIKLLEYEIKHPNEFIGKENCRETGYFKFETTYEYGKRLGSKIIYAGSDSYLGGISKNGVSIKGWPLLQYSINDTLDKRYSDVYGLRKLYFLYPYVAYGNYIHQFPSDENKILINDEETKVNDFSLLDEIDNNKIVEMALSFDKEYIYEDINNIIDNKLITFYWVDNNSEEEKKRVTEEKVPTYDVVGIKASVMPGQFEHGTRVFREDFKEAVKKLKEIGHDQDVQNIDENNFKISGIVVVGSPKEIKALQNNPMIKHAIIGNVVDKY
ncbi:anti sigma factor C-terminal domain-containing protein [Clostridium sp. C2-6-12]|uniref:anti sigma factor C-terminal domain-containing protein n=1 Tax=Clostridium sp. C2-6-12 TaxID=2698832 RepID=UPI0013713C37|nr:anti sigma factor C-terminal domain-containing protein [Clostridium sp. C2-6-12]